MGCDKSLTAGDTILTPSELRKNAQDELRSSSAETLVRILSNPSHENFCLLKESLAVAFGGRDKMTGDEYHRLPQAFSVVLQQHPDAMGILQKLPAHHGPGASAVQHPYEILAAAALMTATWSSSLGHSVHINKEDRTDFGLKLSHGPSQPKVHGTIEADIIVHRGSDRVAMDAKHTRGSTYTATDDLSRQLAGIRNGFNDGKIQGFYYVTNGAFGSSFRDLVDRTNLELVKDWITESQELHFRSDAPIPVEHLSEAERKRLPTDTVHLNKLTAGDPTVKNLAKQHGVPQIGLCEHVVFRR